MPISFKYQLVFFLLLFTINSGFAEDLDSLSLKLENCKSEEKYELLTLLADEYYYAGKLLKAADSYKQARIFEERLNYPDLRHISESYGNEGYCHYEIGQYAKAINLYELALDAAVRNKDSVEIASLNSNLGTVYHNLGNFDKSVVYYQKALKIDQLLNDSAAIAIDNSVIGNVLFVWGKYDEAIKFFEKSLKFAEIINDSCLIELRLRYIGNVYLEQKKYSSALKYYERSLEINLKIGNAMRLAGSYNQVASVYIKIENYKKAKEYLIIANNLIKTTEVIKSQAVILSSLGRVEIYLGNYYIAERELVQSLKMAKELGLLQLQISNYKFLAELYSEWDNYKNAFQNFKEYSILKDSVFNMESQKAISDFQVKYETEKKEQEIKILNTEKAYNKIRRTKRRLTLFSVVFISLLLLILFIIKYRQYRNRKVINAILNDKNQQLNQLVSTKDRFISIIAHDLKNPFSAFVNISGALDNKFEQMQPEEAKELITNLHDSSLKMKEMLHSLLEWAQMQNGTKSIKIERLNLKSTIVLAIELSKEMAMAKEISIINNLDERIEVDACRNGVLTITNNLISNAIKFSPIKSNIYIEAKINTNIVEISVKDQGIGIDKDDIDKLFKIEEDTHKIGDSDEKGTGMGLILCKELIEKMNGEIKTESVKLQGSKFIFSLPLSKET